MTNLALRDLLKESIEKTFKAYSLLESSLDHLSREDIESYRTAEDQEPMDAFIMRLERFTELVLGNLAKSVSLYEQTALDGTVRDRLLLLEKLGIIDSLDTWIDIRNTRNKIVHDYLENIAIEIYHKTTTEYQRTFEFFRKGITEYMEKKNLKDT